MMQKCPSEPQCGSAQTAGSMVLFCIKEMSAQHSHTHLDGSRPQAGWNVGLARYAAARIGRTTEAISPYVAMQLTAIAPHPLRAASRPNLGKMSVACGKAISETPVHPRCETPVNSGDCVRPDADSPDLATMQIGNPPPVSASTPLLKRRISTGTTVWHGMIAPKRAANGPDQHMQRQKAAAVLMPVL